MECLGVRTALPRGRTECVPPRKPPSTLFPAFPREAIRARITNAAEGRAPHAREEGVTLSEMLSPSGHRPLAYPWIVTPCPGPPPALPPGRGDRAPPRKPPSPLSQGFPRKAIPARIAHPPEGRAPHARNVGITPKSTLFPFGHRFIVNACGGNGMPRRTYGLATRTRRAHPSEKIAFRAFSEPHPSRPDTVGSASPRRGGLRTPAGMACA